MLEVQTCAALSNSPLRVDDPQSPGLPDASPLGYPSLVTSFFRPSFLWLLLLAWLSGGLPAVSEGRLESEFKLDVPSGQANAIWKYLQTAYGPGGKMIGSLGAEYQATFAVEKFVDRYYDTSDLRLLKRQEGLRHRSRSILAGSDFRKDNRQLVQLKLSNGGDGVVREELKFEVRDNVASRRLPGDEIPVVGLIKRSQRPGFLEALALSGIDPADLRQTITLLQTRSRAYISHRGQPFATITVDEASVHHWYASTSFEELEMELNEIAYTEADEASRAQMLEINTRLKADLFSAFPGLRQDQTPKYNKAMQRMAAVMPTLSLSLALGAPPELLLLGLIGLAAPVWLCRRWNLRQRRLNRPIAQQAQRVENHQ